VRPLQLTFLLPFVRFVFRFGRIYGVRSFGEGDLVTQDIADSVQMKRFVIICHYSLNAISLAYRSGRGQLPTPNPSEVCVDQSTGLLNPISFVVILHATDPFVPNYD